MPRSKFDRVREAACGDEFTGKSGTEAEDYAGATPAGRPCGGR
jgi:hypothetical protein